MAVRLPPRLSSIRSSTLINTCQCRRASIVASPPSATTDPSSHDFSLAQYPSTQPPSHKRPEFRKSQLHRQYQSLLRSSPTILIFQHNNLKVPEWAAIRREVASALKAVDDELGVVDRVGEYTRVQVIQTGIFAAALRVVEFYYPRLAELSSQSGTQSDPSSLLAHGLSREAWRMSKSKRLKHGLEPLLSGPLMLVSFPAVSPAHVKAVLSRLAPSKDIPAPKRRSSPEFYEPAVQNGLQKLMLLGARIEGKVFDTEGARWVAGIPGGLDGLRAQLVGLLSSSGASITNALEAAGRSLYLTVEGRRSMLEEAEKPVDTPSADNAAP